MTAEKQVPQSLSLGGMVRFKVYDLMASARTHGRVEYHVLTGLREKLFPSDVKTMASVPNNPNSFRLDVLAMMPTIELTEAEREIMARGMSEYMANPGVPHIDGEWFYPLLEDLEKEKQGK